MVPDACNPQEAKTSHIHRGASTGTSSRFHLLVLFSAHPRVTLRRTFTRLSNNNPQSDPGPQSDRLLPIGVKRHCANREQIVSLDIIDTGDYKCPQTYRAARPALVGFLIHSISKRFSLLHFSWFYCHRQCDGLQLFEASVCAESLKHDGAVTEGKEQH